MMASNERSEIRIPVVIGRNRLRGNSRGAMVDDEDGGSLQALQILLAEEARAAGVEATAQWIRTATRQMLDLYEQARAEWAPSSHDGATIGLVYEATMPSGRIVLLGEKNILARIQKHEARH